MYGYALHSLMYGYELDSSGPSSVNVLSLYLYDVIGGILGTKWKIYMGMFMFLCFHVRNLYQH